MQLDFEWDDAKAEANLDKHGVDFHDAIQVFSDLRRMEYLDPCREYGEDRFVTVGVAEGRLLVVVYTERGRRIRIISARQATSRERRTYHEDPS